MYELIVESEFAAAHQLREYQGSCERLHGHNYRVELAVEGEKLASNGLLADFRSLKQILSDSVDRFDHFFLNELEPFRKDNPSAENIAQFIFKDCATRMPQGVNVKSVTVWESPKCAARYTGS
jgi:6-pyruvoyltetrahydropterin/6-carboxytetrahydropterin synthase